MGKSFYGAKDAKKPRFAVRLQIVVEFYVMLEGYSCSIIALTSLAFTV